MNRHDEIHSLVAEHRQPWSEIKKLEEEHNKIVAESGEVGFHLTPIVTRVGVMPHTYSIGYWGTQSRIAPQTKALAQKVTGLMDNVVWVDPTMGGLAIPQWLRYDGYASKTILNDRGFLSVCASAALLSGKPLPPYEQLCGDVDNVIPVEGYISGKTGSEFVKKWFAGTFSPEVLNYMDGYVQQYKDRPEMLLALGTVLTKRHTFRSIDFDKKLTRSLGVHQSVDPYKKLPEGSMVSTRPGLKDYLKLELKKICEAWCPKGTGDTYNLDVMEFGKIAAGDIMYCDFAWPWRDGRPVIEYSFPLKIAALLTQKDPENTWYWNGDTILPGVGDFLESALPRFKFIIVNTQSSNKPDGPELLQYLTDRFGKDRIVAFAYTDYVSMAGTKGKNDGVRMYRESYVVVRGEVG